MDSRFFESGNYIYECKTSPSRIGEYFDTSYLKSSIRKLRGRWGKGDNVKLPSGYRYVFPVNYLDDEAITTLKDLQKDYPDVDVRYYDCDKVHNLVLSLEKVGDLKSLVDYINQVRGR